MSSNSLSMFEYQAPGEDAAKDGLFLERLDTFMEKSLGDIKAFADRELRPYEDTRRCIAQWHAKYLFQPITPSLSTKLSKDEQVRAVLCDTSRILEGLSVTAGVQSFLLAVDPTETSDGGFLGGSVIGREFWRGLRGGGDHGAQAFKAHCSTHLQNVNMNRNFSQPPAFDKHFSTPPPKAGLAKSIKNELYESARTALRLASGVRNAEMKWSNPERLDMYGVRLVGWPEDIPAQNPSTLKVGQNKALLEALQNGSMKFERFFDPSILRPTAHSLDGEDTMEDFSWAYDADAGSDSPPQERATRGSTAPSSSKQSVVVDPSPVPAVSISESAPENRSWSMELQRTGDVDPVLATYRERNSWGEEVTGHVRGTTPDEYYNETTPDPTLTRPRKRPRSEETGDSRIT